MLKISMNNSFFHSNIFLKEMKKIKIKNLVLKTLLFFVYAWKGNYPGITHKQREVTLIRKG